MGDRLQGLNLYLIGMMGTGKTTVGQRLAKELGYRFFDTDVLIERVAQKSINELFAEDGETFFRDLESQVLGEVSACTRSVIATGGGAVLRPVNWGYLRHGLIIWLDAPISLLVERLAEDNTRPLLKIDDLSLKLETLLAERKSLYQEADLQIAIAKNENPEQIVSKILEQAPNVLKSPEKSPQPGEINPEDPNEFN
ncbi:MAG: shikimate kinase [Snowella sp.]|jgi:shikimate kinase|nr:MAG: shikimate kinase [Snowella sp.]